MSLCSYGVFGEVKASWPAGDSRSARISCSTMCTHTREGTQLWDVCLYGQQPHNYTSASPRAFNYSAYRINRANLFNSAITYYEGVMHEINDTRKPSNRFQNIFLPKVFFHSSIYSARCLKNLFFLKGSSEKLKWLYSFLTRTICYSVYIFFRVISIPAELGDSS